MLKSQVRIWFAALLCSLLLACGSSPGDSDAFDQPKDFGNPPRPTTQSPTGLLLIASLCLLQGGSELGWVDGNGEPRKACLLKPIGASAGSKRPLLVWLHPSLAPPDTIISTNILLKLNTADLSGDPDRPGFNLLLPAGRDTQHFYPPPDDVGIGWDNWYRNLDRSDPQMNVDAAAIDEFIRQAKATGVVDEDRVYLSGWSNGAAMALLYALNTPRIAAAAVYSAPDPWSDITDPNPQRPFANQRTPIYGLHNSCDIAGICTSGAAMHAQLADRYSSLVQRHVIVDDFQLGEVPQCNAACASQENFLTLGTLNHLRWPLLFTDDMFAFLRDHPL